MKCFAVCEGRKGGANLELCIGDARPYFLVLPPWFSPSVCLSGGRDSSRLNHDGEPGSREGSGVPVFSGVSQVAGVARAAAV